MEPCVSLIPGASVAQISIKAGSETITAEIPTSRRLRKNSPAPSSFPSWVTILAATYTFACGCSQSCRWKYGLFDMPFGQERNSLTDTGEIEEEFSMSAVDMSMIEHIPELIENGVDSFKIEGRMKSIHYVSTVSNVYKAAVDCISQTISFLTKRHIEQSIFPTTRLRASATIRIPH